MADELFSATGGNAATDPAYQVGPVDPKIAAMFASLSNAVMTAPQAITAADIPSIFPAASLINNAAALTKLITDMTSTPEKLAAFTDLVAFISKFKAA